MKFTFTSSLPEGEFTFADHKFPVDIEGHPNSVGGIAINVTKVE